jgi:hypothetical protein
MIGIVQIKIFAQHKILKNTAVFLQKPKLSTFSTDLIVLQKS